MANSNTLNPDTPLVNLVNFVIQAYVVSKSYPEIEAMMVELDLSQSIIDIATEAGVFANVDSTVVNNARALKAAHGATIQRVFKQLADERNEARRIRELNAARRERALLS